MSLSFGNRLKPLFNRVLIQRASVAKQTSGGIMIPESAMKGELNEGTVVAVGPGKLDSNGSLVPVSVKLDDKVLLPEYGGVSLKQGDTEYILLKDEELLAVIES